MQTKGPDTAERKRYVFRFGRLCVWNGLNSVPLVTYGSRSLTLQPWINVFHQRGRSHSPGVKSESVIWTCLWPSSWLVSAIFLRWYCWYWRWLSVVKVLIVCMHELIIYTLKLLNRINPAHKWIIWHFHHAIIITHHSTAVVWSVSEEYKGHWDLARGMKL